MKKHDEEQNQNFDSIHVDEGADIELESAGSEAQKIQQLKAKIKALEAEKLEYLTGWQRAKADAVNLRREALESAEKARSNANASLIESLLSVLDSFSHATTGEAWEKIDPTWQQGVLSIQSQLQKILSEYGLEEVPALGEIFNPALHEAVATEPTDSQNDGKVLKVLQPGYLFKTKLLRPARVITGETK